MALGSTAITGQSRSQLRAQMLTSMFGRRAGMDARDYECGEEDTRLPIDNITTTVPTSLSPNGISVFSCTAGTSVSHALLAPVSGIYKELVQISSSTAGIAVQFGPNAQIVTTAGSSFNACVFAGVGHCVSLFCISTSTSNGPIWVSASPASPGLTFSTY